jgi:hypothetical protein
MFIAGQQTVIPPKGCLMRLTTNIVFQIIAKIFSKALLILLLVILPAACSEKETPENRSKKTTPETFTFFELGRNSALSKQIRKDLGNKLGRDAIQRRNILELEINYPGFLKAYFPDINKLNQKLNFPPGERVDHNTTKLMYRYAQKQNTPFDYVELIFSNYTLGPLVFKILFQKDESNIFDALESKYGPPKSIKWDNENGSSFYWIKHNDVLTASLVPNQFGDPEYQIVIYFTENLNELVSTEQAEKEEREQQKANSGKSAF